MLGLSQKLGNERESGLLGALVGAAGGSVVGAV